MESSCSTMVSADSPQPSTNRLRFEGTVRQNEGDVSHLKSLRPLDAGDQGLQPRFYWATSTSNVSPRRIDVESASQRFEEMAVNPQNCETGERDDAPHYRHICGSGQDLSPSAKESEYQKDTAPSEVDSDTSIIRGSAEGMSLSGHKIMDELSNNPSKVVILDSYQQSDVFRGGKASLYHDGSEQKDVSEEVNLATEGEYEPGGFEEEMASIGQLTLTKPAPDFETAALVNGEFQQVKLSNYRGKYVVLFFYPLDFTFVCPTEIIAFSDRVEEFRAIQCEVMACSTDSTYSHLAWVDTPRKRGGLGPMKIPLLSDKTMEIAKKYGCLKEDEGIAFRGLFIIDDKGNLRQITINDLPVGRSVDETLRLVQAFQFTDKHGEVCPAGWKPGKDTMRPNPKESQKYFSKVN